MKIKAESKYIKITPRKLKEVADAVCRLPLNDVIDKLKFLNKKGAKIVLKTIESALSNAVNNFKLMKKDLKVDSISVNDGPFLKRWRPAARGAMHGYKKRSSHIKVILKTKKTWDKK